MYGVSSIPKLYSDHPHPSFARVIGNNITNSSLFIVSKTSKLRQDYLYRQLFSSAFTLLETT